MNINLSLDWHSLFISPECQVPGADLEINPTLESLCLSMTEHALGGKCPQQPLPGKPHTPTNLVRPTYALSERVALQIDSLFACTRLSLYKEMKIVTFLFIPLSYIHAIFTKPKCFTIREATVRFLLLKERRADSVWQEGLIHWHLHIHINSIFCP